MKTTLKTIFTILVLFVSTQLFSQTEAEMKAWMEYSTPGQVHEMIARSNGEWTGEITMWMEPGAPPTKSTGNAMNTMILGGRYQQSNYTGNMMGMPFEGISLLGYDNAKKKFYNSWIDNMGTGMMMLVGEWDDATKTINFNGSCTDPMTGKDMKVRQTFQIIDDNNQKMEMFMTQDGPEMKSMEILFKRK